MNDPILENRKLKAQLQIWRARHKGMSDAADHFCGQFLRERRRLAAARRALADIADNEPLLRALQADYVVDTAKRAIEEIEQPKAASCFPFQKAARGQLEKTK